MLHGPHILITSESGTGKTYFAATIINARNPRPVLVQAFDPSDKLTSYRRRADRIELEEYPFGMRENLYKGDTKVAVIERWGETEGKGSRGITMKGGARVGGQLGNVKQGLKFEAYVERMRGFNAEAPEWYALIHDSTTFCEFAVRSYLSGVMKVQDNMMIWAQATDELERFYMALFPNLPITTIVLSHASTERTPSSDGVSKYEVRLPGRLARDIIASFGEVYRAFTKLEKGEDGITHPRFFMQTETDGIWRCSSQLGVESPFGPSPTWKSVWQLAMQLRPAGEPE